MSARWSCGGVAGTGADLLLLHYGEKGSIGSDVAGGTAAHGGDDAAGAARSAAGQLLDGGGASRWVAGRDAGGGMALRGRSEQVMSERAARRARRLTCMKN